MSTRCAFVALVGRPNVGKSTLLNALVGEKISIVTPKPQTTRHRINGIRTEGQTQLVFVDTPGLHRRAGKPLNAAMNRAATASLSDVDVVVLVTEAGRWTDEDEFVLEHLRPLACPVGLVVNKVDRVPQRERLLPEIERLSQRHPFAFVVPLSARRAENVNALLTELNALAPTGPFLYPSDQPTDRSERFLVSETVREKLVLALHDELPYELAVEVERFRRDAGLLRIDAVIWVGKANHKAMVIGRGGRVLKHVGERARRELEARLSQKVFLRLWVKVKEDWYSDERSLRALGLDES